MSDFQGPVPEAVGQGRATNMLSPATGEPLSGNASDVGNLSISSDAPGVGPPSYPPTQVKQWLTCPMFWQLSKRWVPRLEPWSPHKLVGSSIHAGIAAHLRAKRDGSTLDDQAYLHEAHRVLGEGYVQQETWDINGLSKLVTKGYCLLRDAIVDRLAGATILSIEEKREHRIIDCLLERNGGLEVMDWKTKINLDDRYLQETLRSVIHQWQLLDYAWHAQEWFQKPVDWAGWGLVVLGPSKGKVHFPTIKITQERLSQWRRDAEQIWMRMAFQEAVPSGSWHNWEACTDRHLHFGKECVFVTACHELAGDENWFSGRYVSSDEDN